MTLDIHFNEGDWQRIERDWAAWWAGELERPLVLMDEKVHPAGRTLPRLPKFAASFPLSMPAALVIDHVQANLEATHWYGDAFPKWWPNFGPGMMAGFLGAKVHSVPETVWFSPASDVPAAAVQPRYDAENVWWQRVRSLTTEAVERFGGAVAVGHTDLGGNLDVVASLRETQRLLYEVHDEPEQVDRLVSAVTGLWLRYYQELDALIAPAGRGTTPWAAIWSPKRCYMLQCDFSYMISPRMFERFVMPDLSACCDYLDHAMYHLDGKGEIAHLDMLLSLPRLRGIQWIPGAGAPRADRWLPLLKRIRDAGKLCQVYVTPAGARRIVRNLGGRGFVLAITDTLSARDAADLMGVLSSGG